MILNAHSILGSLAKIAVMLSGLLSYLFRLPCCVSMKCISEHLRECVCLWLCLHILCLHSIPYVCIQCETVCVCVCIGYTV